MNSVDVLGKSLICRLDEKISASLISALSAKCEAEGKRNLGFYLIAQLFICEAQHRPEAALALLHLPAFNLFYCLFIVALHSFHVQHVLCWVQLLLTVHHHLTAGPWH